MAEIEEQNDSFIDNDITTMSIDVEASRSESSEGTSESALRIQQLHAVEKVHSSLCILLSTAKLMFISHTTANCTADSNSRQRHWCAIR
jgi:hypothetical protein